MLSNQNPIDALGEIKARIADLEKIEKDLRERVVAMGVGAHEGDTFRATVSVSEREKLDMDAVRQKLSPQFIRAHTTVSDVTMVRVVARK